MPRTKQPMNDRQTAIFNTVCAVLAVSLLYPLILAAVPALAAAFLLLETLKDEASDLAVTRDKKTSSIKNVKVNSRSSIARPTFKYSRKLLAYGNAAKITELMNLASHPVSIIKQMRFENAAEYTLEILDYLKKYLPDLGRLKVTQADVDEYEAMVNDYSSTLSKTDATHSQAVGETLELTEMFTKLMAQLKEIDILIDGLRDDYPDFCNAYDVARKIHRYGLRHMSPEELAAFQAKAEASKLKAKIKRKEKAQKAKQAKLLKLQIQKAEAEKFIEENRDKILPA